MAENKTSFILYAEYIDIFEELSDSDAGQLVKHIFNYVNDKNPETDNKMVKLSFIQIKHQLKRDLKKWDEKIISKSNAGKMSAAKKLFDKYKKNIIDTIKDVNIEFEINYCNEHKKECDTDSYMVYYYDLCIDFLLKQKPTKSTPVESVEINSTKSTVNVDVDVDVDGNDIDIKEKEVFVFRKELLKLCPDKEVVKTFLEIRKKKKGVNSEIAFNALKIEIEKSGKTAEQCLTICCEKSWAGFNAEWINSNFNKQPNKEDNPRFHRNGKIKYTNDL